MVPVFGNFIKVNGTKSNTMKSSVYWGNEWYYEMYGLTSVFMTKYCTYINSHIYHYQPIQGGTDKNQIQDHFPEAFIIYMIHVSQNIFGHVGQIWEPSQNAPKSW